MHGRESDIASLDPATQKIVPLFHPRKQHWRDHFRVAGAIIEPLSPEVRVTARLLRFNIAQRVIERRLLIALGRFREL
jgi:hypothetical protein